ncbi:hypothetical protein NQZ79_g5216 [Umbelopsis isabellina]|nr:hypothetical protein NQZ79_g5216 [Umbelopsis isabellina]
MRFLPFRFSKRSIHEENEASNEKAQPATTDNVDLERGDTTSLDSVSSDESVQEQQGQKKRSRWTGGVSTKHRKIVRIFGQIGFCAKGMVYGIIGVLILTNVSGQKTPNNSTGNESPQGAFLLLGGIPGIGRPLLIVMAIGLLTYIIWRLWESFTGQGSDASFGKKKNFFRYRLSPFVSGLVYIAYTYYIMKMIFETPEEQQLTASNQQFPANWANSTIGMAGLGIVGIAFIIGTITQLINCVGGGFIRDLRTSEPDFPRKWEAVLVHTAGRIGFFARGAVFCLVSAFMWKTLKDPQPSGNVSVVAKSISELNTNGGGKFFLVVVGVGLVIYGVFAISNAYYKYFPTPPPSRQPERGVEVGEGQYDPDRNPQEAAEEHKKMKKEKKQNRQEAKDRLKAHESHLSNLRKSMQQSAASENHMFP